jgi:hypothetical protein
MKKLLLALSLSIALFGCSSLELEAVSTSAEETERILAMGLSHEENLVEASKLKSSHMVSVVSLQLTNARDEKIQAEVDLIEAEKFSNMVKVSGGNSKFFGPEVSESIKTGVLKTDIDLQNYYLEGTKDLSSGIIAHKLVLSITHNSKNERKYSSANLCDEWNRCDMNEQEINVISSNPSNCTTVGCDYKEVMELNLSDDFLRNAADKGFTFRINAKRKSNKIKVSKAYLMGYLTVVQ